MDKAKGGRIQGWEAGMDGARGCGWGEIETIVLEQHKKKLKS